MRVFLVALLLFPAAALAQSNDSHLAVFGSVGFGSLGDDEGGLGHGLAAGFGVTGAITEHAGAEISVAQLHHERSGPVAWDGDLQTITGRMLYRFGAATSTTRLFAGAGAGYGHYSGTIVDSLHLPPVANGSVVTTNYPNDLHGFGYEAGGGVEIALGKTAFVRPEAWVTIVNGTPTGARSPEPPLMTARATIGAGWRF